MANIVDNLLLKASARGSVARTARLQQMKRQDNNNAICDDLTGWPQGEAVALSMYQTDSSGVPDEDSVTDWVAEVNGNTLINMKLTSGNNRDYDTLNTVVTINFTSEWANRLIEALLKVLNQDGTFRDSIIEEKHIRDNTITERKLANDAITGSKIKDGSVEPKHLTRPYPPIITLGRSDLANVVIGANYVTAAPIPWLAIGTNEHFELIDGSKLKLKTDCSKVKISLAVNTDIPEGNALQARFSVVDPTKPAGSQVLQTIVADTGKTGGMCSIVIPTACVDAKKGYYIEASLAGTFGGTYAIRPARSFLTCEIVN